MEIDFFFRIGTFYSVALRSPWTVACQATLSIVYVKKRLSSTGNYIEDPELNLMEKNVKKEYMWDFPHGPVVKTLSSAPEDMGLIPGLGAKIPHASWPKNQNIIQMQIQDFKKWSTLKKNT